MPQLGEIKYGREIGKKGFQQKFIWAACIICGKERWTPYRVATKKPARLHCPQCVNKFLHPIGSKHWHWKGGRRTKEGYILIWVAPDSPFAAMRTKEGYIYEHRLVMAQYLGRCLQRGEEPHHLNTKRDDNRIENLILTIKGNHPRGYTEGYRQGFKDGLEQGKRCD